MPEKDEVGKQAAAVVILAVGMPEEDVVGRQDGAGCNRAVGVPEEDVVGKQNGAVRIGSRSGVPTQKVANKRRVIKNS